METLKRLLLVMKNVAFWKNGAWTYDCIDALNIRSIKLVAIREVRKTNCFLNTSINLTILLLSRIENRVWQQNVKVYFKSLTNKYFSHYYV